MKLEYSQASWALLHEGRRIVEHGPSRPCCFVGAGKPSVSMYHGNYDIRDFVEERVALRHARVSAISGGARVELARSAHGEPELILAVRAKADGAVVEFERSAPWINRLWWRVAATPDERVWGCGEQFSYFNLRGRHFPLWSSEPGVGRDKSTYITWQADSTAKAGGDYYTTYYPQPTYLSSSRYALHADTSAYADFDFRNPDFHELQLWAVPPRIELLSGPTYPELVERVSARFGRQPGLPEWLWKGAILGLKNGPEHAERILDQALAAGVRVSSLWCEDWSGIRKTSFGRRLFWDWRWNESRYPRPREWVAGLNARGIRFMGYDNPALCVDGVLNKEASAAGFLVKDRTGGDYVVDFGEFGAGLVDFTNPEASSWYGERIIRREMIDRGLDGWMADFGEYLPTDAKLASGVDAMVAHNAYPMLWAKANADAIAAAGRTGDILFFMRSGFTGAQGYCPLLFSGDQSVDFSRHDGLQTVVCSALSSGVLGNAFHNCDIGGYTSLFGNKRTPEVFKRWAEMAAFTPVMRTHEGNRPDDNFQFWQDEVTLAHFARMTRINGALQPYSRRLAREAVSRGIPLMRPLFLHFPDDPEAQVVQDEYLYGEDLLVAPVHEGGRDAWQPYLPKGARWVHLWTKKSFDGGAKATVPAPLGMPPVFVREGSPAQAELLGLAQI